MHLGKWSNKHTNIQTFVHICIHTYIHTYVRTYVHTYIHTNQRWETWKVENDAKHRLLFVSQNHQTNERDQKLWSLPTRRFPLVYATIIQSHRPATFFRLLFLNISYSLCVFSTILSMVPILYTRKNSVLFDCLSACCVLCGCAGTALLRLLTVCTVLGSTLCAKVFLIVSTLRTFLLWALCAAMMYTLRQQGLLWQLLSVILQTDFEQRSTKTPEPMKAPSLEKLDFGRCCWCHRRQCQSQKKTSKAYC